MTSCRAEIYEMACYKDESLARLHGVDSDLLANARGTQMSEPPRTHTQAELTAAVQAEMFDQFWDAAAAMGVPAGKYTPGELVTAIARVARAEAYRRCEAEELGWNKGVATAKSKLYERWATDAESATQEKP